jgi:hypothetical protein
MAEQWTNHALTMAFDESMLMLAAAVALHAVLSRLQPRGNRVAQFLACGACGAVLLVLKLNSAPELGRLASTACFATYAFLCELYLFVFTMVTSSVSVSLLFGGSAESLAPAGDMVVKRVERMVGAGLVEREQGSLRLTGRGRLLARVFGSLRRVFHGAGRPSGRNPQG